MSEKIKKARQVVNDLCQGRKKWVMQIPANRNEDPDLIISDALSEFEALEKKAEAYRLALKFLYDETADYIRTNNLGDIHHNRSMQIARDLLTSRASSDARDEVKSYCKEPDCEGH